MNSLYFPQKTVTIRTGNKFSRQPVGEVIPNFLSAFSDYDVKAIQSLPGGDVKVKQLVDYQLEVDKGKLTALAF